MAGRPSKPKPTSQDRLVEQKELAETLNVNPSTINRWLKESPPVPTVENGGKLLYPLSTCIHWWKDREVANAVEQNGPEGSDAKTRKELAQARLLELDVAEREGDLVSHEWSIALLLEYLTALNSTLKAHEGKNADRFVGLATKVDAQMALSDMFRTLRTEVDMNLGVGKSEQFSFRDNG